MPVRMTFMTKTTDIKCWQGYGEKGTLVHYWWECKLIRLLCKQYDVSSKKLKIELLYNPTIPLLGIYLKERKSLPQKDLHPHVY